jgi:hypothetical protein
VSQSLGGAGQFQGDAPHDDQIERAVIIVGHEQPVERKQARQQRTEPQYGGSQPREQREIGAEGERHQHDHREKKQNADQRAAADTQRDLDVSANQRRERAHKTLPSGNSRAVIPRDTWVAAMIRPPRAR